MFLRRGEGTSPAPPFTCSISRFRAAVIVGERQLLVMVLYVGRMMVVEMMRHRILHRRVLAAHPRQRVARREGAALFAAVCRTQYPSQGTLGTDQRQIQRRPPREGRHLLEVALERRVRRRVIVGVDWGSGVGLGDGRAVLYRHRHRLLVVGGAVLVASGAAPAVRHRRGAPVTPGHDGKPPPPDLQQEHRTLQATAALKLSSRKKTTTIQATLHSLNPSTDLLNDL
jgi:hypothetical protein